MTEPASPWSEPLAEHVKRVAALVRGDTGTNRLSFEIAALQARAAYDAATSQERTGALLAQATTDAAAGQERVGAALAKATWGLMLATWVLGAATVVLVVVTITRG